MSFPTPGYCGGRVVSDNVGSMASEDPNDFDPEGVTPVTLEVHSMPAALTHAQREVLFGRFDFEPTPTIGDPESIRILGDWVEKNIVSVPLPKIGAGAIKRARVHRLLEKQFAAFWADLERLGLLSRVLTFDGGFVPRYKRRRAVAIADPTRLSNHSWGSAFDLNAPWNPLGSKGVPPGGRGSTRELIGVAVEHGFLNGISFASPYQDPMHFECFKIVG